jgi:hypothetical protein
VEPEIVERVPLRSCARRGAAIDVVADRGREQRSQIVFTRGRGREMVFWQSPRTRKQARPDVRLPTARASGIAELEIVVDAHERYAYRFAGKPVRTLSRGLACGDYAVATGAGSDAKLVAAVERKSLPDLVSSLTSGRLRFAWVSLPPCPAPPWWSRTATAGVHPRPGPAGPGGRWLAELQVRWPMIPIVFCETRALAEEWTYRYLAAAAVWDRDRECRHRPHRPDPRPGRGEDGGEDGGETALLTPRTRWHRRPRGSARGPAPTASRCPTVGGCARRSIGPGGTRTGGDPSLPSAGPLSGPRRSSRASMPTSGV